MSPFQKLLNSFVLIAHSNAVLEFSVFKNALFSKMPKELNQLARPDYPYGTSVGESTRLCYCRRIGT